MSELLDAILNKNLVEANEYFEDRIDSIREQKLLEVKRSLSLTELMGYRGYGAKSGPLVGKSDAEKKAYWKAKIAQRKTEKEYQATTTPKGFGKGGKLSPADIEARKKAGYKRAADVLDKEKKKPEAKHGLRGTSTEKRKEKVKAKAPKAEPEAPEVKLTGEPKSLGRRIHDKAGETLGKMTGVKGRPVTVKDFAKHVASAIQAGRS